MVFVVQVLWHENQRATLRDLYDQVCDALGATNDGQRAGAIELALEGLYLARGVGKESDGRETVYG